MITIREWREGDREAYVSLSVEWLEKYVCVEPADIEIFNDLHGIILDPGGMIWFACDGETPVGTVSMIPMGDGNYELAKLAVTESYKRQGIAEQLMETAIAFAREKQCDRVVLLTNSGLVPAIRLYEKYGFVEVPPTDNEYESADMEMILPLE